MNDRRLSDHIKDHYAKQAPRAETLARLLEQNNAANPSGAKSRWVVPRNIAAAVALVAVLASALFWRGVVAPDWAELAAREVALNHRKHLAPEFVAADYDTLRGAMGKLDFVLVASQRLTGSNLQVVGARYCSIQGHLAAQIRLEDLQGRQFTLYQRSLVEAPDLPSQSEYLIDGVRIEQWQEAGLFFGLASSSNQ